MSLDLVSFLEFLRGVAILFSKFFSFLFSSFKMTFVRVNASIGEVRA